MSPSEARICAGLSIEQAAKRARITASYLRRKEREGDFSFVVASRLERVYRCDITVFLAGSKPKSTICGKETNGRKKREAKNQETLKRQGGAQSLSAARAMSREASRFNGVQS